MNVKKIKKVIVIIGAELLFTIAVALTVAFVITKVGSPDASKAITTELNQQREENRKFREQIDSFERNYTADAERIKELEGSQRRLEDSNTRLEELIRARQDNDRATEDDINELGNIVQRDREALSRIRELLQEEDPEYDSY